MDRIRIGGLEGEEDLDRLMEIWLRSNLEAHDFIDRDYFLGNYDQVRELLPQARLYIVFSGEEILGFAGLVDSYLAGIFIARPYRGQGLGSLLLDRIREHREEVYLDVYRKNTRAYGFYLGQGFRLVQEKLDEENQEVEYLLHWKKPGQPKSK